MKNKSFKQVTHKTDSYQIPFLITCNVSGLVKTYTSEEYINGKLDRFGGLQKMLATYVCRDALKLRKKGMSDADIKLKLNPDKPAAEPVVTDAVTPPAEPVAPEGVTTPEGTVDITPEVQDDSALEAQAEAHLNSKPIAKKDKRGWFRDEKGRVIAKDRLGEFDLREADGVTAVAA